MLPLSGLRVVDLSDENGPLCGRLLSDLGADVLLVEPPGGASSRQLPPFAPDGETSLYFGYRNAGKRSLTLDLESEAGRAELDALLAECDVLVESTHPGTLDRWGLDEATLASRHPHLVVTSISDFGQTGPYADYVGTNMVSVAMGGMMYRAGIAEKPPVCIPGNFAYDVAAGSAGLGTLLAFWHRMQTGRGQKIDVSAMDAVANLTDWSLPNYSLNPSIGQRAGAGIYTLYRCSDGFIRMIILPKRHWEALLDWVGHPEELADPQYMEFIHRLMNMDKIIPALEGFFRDQSKIEVAKEAQRRGIPATPLLAPREVMSNDHTVSRGTFASLPVGTAHMALMPSGFVTVDGERVGPTSGPPPVGGEQVAGFEGNEVREALKASFKAEKPAAQGSYPLRGLRVIDCGVGAVGVEVGKLFAHYGAEVIKIESASAPDFIRVIMSSYMNPSFASSNCSKQSFGVDLKNEKGRALLEELLRQSDVFIENNGWAVTERLGFGPEALREINPRLVSFSSQMPGSYGAWKEWIGYGPNTHPISGLQYLWNYPEDEEQPAGSTAVHPDHFTGRLGAFMLLAGLIAREHTGQGMHFDIAQFEVAIGLLGDLFGQESLAPGSVRPIGNTSDRGAPWGCYRCLDDDQEEWCVINVRSDAEWAQLRRALGEPEWARDEKWLKEAGRREAEKELGEHLGAWTRTRSPRDVMERLQEHAVPCGIVAHPGHHMSDPQMLHRDYARPVQQQELSTILLEGPAFIGSDLATVITEQAPMLGEHTRDIARRLLHLDESEIDQLIANGTLEEPPSEFKLV